MAVVIARMRTCNKTHRVTATMNSDGNFDIQIESDCYKVQEFGNRLKYVTMEDITDFEKSRINKREFRGDLSPPCLSPIAIYNAAWIEAGMLSKSLVKRIKENCVDFIEIE